MSQRKPATRVAMVDGVRKRVPAPIEKQAEADDFRAAYQEKCREKLGFGPGDLVQLKSGGFPMTVVDFSTNCTMQATHLTVMYCTMMSGPQLEEIDLPAVALQKYEPLRDHFSGRTFDDLPF